MAGEFVSDIKQIRRRARAHMEQGPVTPWSAPERGSGDRARVKCAAASTSSRIDGLSCAKAVAELVTEDGVAESVVCGPGSTCIH